MSPRIESGSERALCEVWDFGAGDEEERAADAGAVGAEVEEVEERFFFVGIVRVWCRLQYSGGLGELFFCKEKFFGRKQEGTV